MNSRMLFRSFAAVLIFAALVLCAGNMPGLAQSKKPAAPAVQSNDADYTSDIQKFTTEKYFSTELVDHLPASATVPSPKKILGYAVGTEGKLTYTKDIYRYYRELAKVSPRVKVWTAGKSEEGREFLLVAVVTRIGGQQMSVTRKFDPAQLGQSFAFRYRFGKSVKATRKLLVIRKKGAGAVARHPLRIRRQCSGVDCAQQAVHPVVARIKERDCRVGDEADAIFVGRFAHRPAFTPLKRQIQPVFEYFLQPLNVGKRGRGNQAHKIVAIFRQMRKLHVVAQLPLCHQPAQVLIAGTIGHDQWKAEKI